MSLHISCRVGDFDKHTLDVVKLIFEQGKLYSAGDDGKVKVWSNDLVKEGDIQAHATSVFGLASSQESIFSCSNDGLVKSFELATLEDKGNVIKEENTEFWTVKYQDGVLYAADDQGNILILKNGKFFGSINVAEPVKHMAIYQNLLFTSKDNDVVATDLHLGGDKPQFGIVTTLQGRGPIAVIHDKLIFLDRSGKDLILSSIVTTEGHKHIKDAGKVTGAHEMIANAIVAVQWDDKILAFTGGWDKTVKVWIVGESTLKLAASINVDIVVNTIAVGEKKEIYAGGSDGHILRIDVNV